MRWFGTAWPSPESPAPVCEDQANWTPTPLSEPCFECGEPIERSDSGVVIPYWDGDGVFDKPCHLTCFLRSIGVSLL